MTSINRSNLPSEESGLERRALALLLKGQCPSSRQMLAQQRITVLLMEGCKAHSIRICFGK